MTTTITKTVGSAGRNYSTIAAAIAAIPANLVSVDQSWVLELYNDSQFNTPNVGFTGITTDATHTITMRPAAGQGFRDHLSSSTPLYPSQSNGVYIAQVGGSAGGTIGINNAYVYIDGLQIDTTSSDYRAIYQTSGLSVVSNCLIKHGISAGNASPAIEAAAAGFTSVNNLIIVVGSSATGITDSGSCSYLNTTVIAPAGSPTRGINSNYSAPLIKNCAVFGFTTASFRNSASGSDYNVASDTTAPGTHSLQSKTFANQFVSTTDLRVKAGADLINAGTPDTADTGGVDIIRQARNATTPTVGAYEYGVTASVPSNTTVPTITGTATVGQTLTASTGAWTGSPTSYAYQWKRSGTAISGATASTYLLVTADAGTTITVGVIATNTTGASSQSVSSATGTVGSAPVTLTVAGTAPGGTVGTAYTATFTASGGTSPYTYSVSSGSLPAGVTLNTSTGALSGTPTTAGSSTFVIHAVDSGS